MTAKEKAKELLDKYYNTECIEETDDAYMCEHLAKKCAIVCVDEIIEYVKEWDVDLNLEFNNYDKPHQTYWEQVKVEINGL